MTERLATETLRAEYLIPGRNLEEFERRIAVLNKRARALGVTEITHETRHAYNEHEVSLGSTTGWVADRNVIVDNGKKVIGELGIDEHALIFSTSAKFTGVVRDWLHLTVEGESPKYDGWILTGVLEPLVLEDGSENIIKAVPGYEVPAEYRDLVGECDHCKTKRRRNDTFVVLHEERNEHKMVGRNCIKDFLGHTDPHKLANLAEWLADVGSLCGSAEDEEWFGGGGGFVPSAWDLEHFLSWTAAVIRADGWVSRGEVYETGRGTATADTVLYMLAGKPPLMNAREWEKLVERYTPDDGRIERGRKAAEWAAALNANGELDNDYLYNLNLVARAGYVTRKTAGLAASALVAHTRAEEREVERAKKATWKNEWYDGNVGDKIDIAVYCEQIIEMEGWSDGYHEAPPTGLHKMRDAEGRSFSWFATSAMWMEVGDIHWIRGSIKKLDTYKHYRTTMLTRVRMIDGRDAEIVEALNRYRDREAAGKKLTKPMRAKRDRLAVELTAMREALATLKAEHGVTDDDA